MPVLYGENQSKTLHTVIVLDSSGSMGMIRQATVDAFNQQVRTMQEQDAGVKTTVGLVPFSTKVEEPIVWNADPRTMKLLTLEQYVPEGWTALNDAIGTSIERMRSLPDADSPNTNFLLVIITDGAENKSTEYKREQIAQMIEELQGTGRWTFTYVGANQDAKQVASTFKIPVGNALTFQPTTRSMNFLGNKVMPGAYSNLVNNIGNNVYTSTATFFEEVGAVDDDGSDLLTTSATTP